MKNRNTVLSFIAIVATVAIVFTACRKINEATELGGDLIPPVDNINTFDTTLTVQAFNDTFGLATDSLRLAKGNEFFLGRITNDPFFGTTDARMFFQLQPFTFKHSFLAAPGKLYIDSVILLLDYVETYGDTTLPQTVNVYELDQSNNFRSDSSYLIRKSDLTYSTQLGSKTFAPSILNDSIKALWDTTVNQLRIKLNNSFGQRLLDYDSSALGAYFSDSAFKTKFKGFALQSTGGGNAVMGFNLAGPNTALAIYYRYDKTSTTIDDTVAYFQFNINSAASNYIKRDYSGSNLLASLNNGPGPDPIIYIQGSPGSFANVKIPALAALSNRVVHRAELIVEQLYDISDNILSPPQFLYLDAFDPTIAGNNKFRTIPYDFDLGQSGFPYGSFGIAPLIARDGSGNEIKTWKFNISRYVQHVVNRTETSYDLRLHAPYTLNGKTRTSGSTTDFDIPPDNYLNPTIVKGRVRLVGTTGVTDPHRIRLRLVYSKL